MKGILEKTSRGWIVKTILAKGQEAHMVRVYPLVKVNVDALEPCVLGEYGEVDFEIEHQYNEVFNRAETMARLSSPMPNTNRLDKLETLAKLLAKTWFYCDWRWESPNERVMQMLMQDLGLYPFKDEDEMIQQTKIDEGLDKQLYKEASIRIPAYGKLSKDLVENKTPKDPFDLICDDPDCKHCAEDIAQMEDDGLTDDEWLIKEKHKEIEATAVGFAEWIGEREWMSIWVEDKWMWEYQEEVNSNHPYFGYKTNEQLFELYKTDKTPTPSITLKERVVGVLKYHSIKAKEGHVVEECDFEELADNLISCFEQFGPQNKS